MEGSAIFIASNTTSERKERKGERPQATLIMGVVVKSMMSLL